MVPVVGISELAGVGCFVHNNRREGYQGMGGVGAFGELGTGGKHQPKRKPRMKGLEKMTKPMQTFYVSWGA